ncbi:MAG: glycosyltransferase family 4 protein [Chloracidobacterium sp.]|nr:glycosyltransferase family 4 protein [Chloracidobacterium sp.]
MRVLQISSSRTYGGGERHFVDLCRGLASRGHEVFAGIRPTNIWQDRLDFLPPENILHVSIRNSFGILSATRIAAFAREKEIDIIHAHVARDYIPASIACALSGRAKFVLTRHVLFPLKPFNRLALTNLSMAIAVSPGVERSLQRIFPRNKVVVIPNGIEPPYPNGPGEIAKLRNEFRAYHQIPEDAYLIGTVGEITPLKGQRDLLLAANEIAAEFPDIRFIVVGRDNSASQAFRRELKRLVRVLGLEDRFYWLDWVEDTKSLYAALDMFVSASHTESFGMAILEAIGSGVPVIVTDTEGARELVRDGGRRVPVGEPVKLAERLRKAALDRDAERSAALSAMDEAVKTYSLDRMIERTERVYLEL